MTAKTTRVVDPAAEEEIEERAKIDAENEKAKAPTSHASCKHAKTGTEGKKGRAACRRQRAAKTGAKK